MKGKTRRVSQFLVSHSGISSLLSKGKILKRLKEENVSFPLGQERGRRAGLRRAIRQNGLKGSLRLLLDDSVGKSSCYR